MRFAVSLLTVIGIASIIGTVLKQNEPYANYIIQFGQFWFDFFEMLGLYDVYHSAWFLLILLFLVISTSLCIYRNSPLMLSELRTYRETATEKSLRAFSHKHAYQSVHTFDDTRQTLQQFLTLRGFRFKTVRHADGGELIAAKAGSYQRLGYIFTHAAIVIICVGGLLDGNVPFKVQELLGYKKVETLDIPESEVPAVSRLSTANLSFRANMTLPEGTSSDVAFQRMRDGYLVQELPFRIELKDFRIEHYATGQPKSFESDLLIIDPELKEPLAHTISVNHPLIYKGVAIYQSDFQDGGTKLKLNVWGLFSTQSKPLEVDGTIFKKAKLGEGDDALLRATARAVDEVTRGIETFAFNKAIASLYGFTNTLAKANASTPAMKHAIRTLAQLMSPMVPHIAESIWTYQGGAGLCAQAPWPKADPALLIDDTVTLPIQINGKRRAEISVPKDMPAAEVEKIALADEAVVKFLAGQPVKKIIVVPGRIINVVV